MTRQLRIFVAILCLSLLFSSLPLPASIEAAQQEDALIDFSADGARIAAERLTSA